MNNKFVITLYLTITPISKKPTQLQRSNNRQRELPLFTKPKGRPKSGITILDLKRVLESRNETAVSVSNVGEIAEIFGISTRTLYTIWVEYKRSFAHKSNPVSN